jgi:putative ABC transport system ATP-binding protein
MTTDVETPEDEASQVATAATLRRAFKVAPALRHGLGLTLLLAIGGTALQLVVPILIQQIIDSGVLEEENTETADLVVRMVLALGAVGLAAVARLMSLRRLARSSSTGLADLRVTTFGYLHRLSVLHVQTERRGALVARVTSDVETMQHFMEWGGVGMILGSAQVALAVAAMLIYQWQLALVVMVGVTIYAVLVVLFQRVLRKAHDRVRLRVSDSLAAIGEAISGLPTVRAYGMEGAMLGKVRLALDRQFRAEYGTGVVAAVLFSSAEVFAGLITATVIAVGVLFGDTWGMSAGTLVAFLFLVNLLVEPVQMLVETIDQAQSAGAGLRKILGVLDTPNDLPDPEGGVNLPDRGLDVRFEDVRFRYPTGYDVLSEVTVNIDVGRRVAVVGETGSGKTTFAKLATRLLDPAAGTVCLSEVPIDRVRFASLRSRVSYVPQEGFLFDGSVADNVRYGKPDADDAAVTAAFADLGLLDWVSSLPAGLGTNVGERGSNLSAGERQLVALVRAWIANPDLLVLDEATSAVDPALEVQIRRAIERLTAGRTSITVAHRLATAEAADEVLVFDQGRLVERGRHADLVEVDGVYAALHRDWEGSTTPA